MKIYNNLNYYVEEEGKEKENHCSIVIMIKGKAATV